MKTIEQQIDEHILKMELGQHNSYPLSLAKNKLKMTDEKDACATFDEHLKQQSPRQKGFIVD